MSISMVASFFDCILLLVNLLFPVYLFCYADATFRTQLSESAVSLVCFIRGTSNLGSCFLSTFSVTRCSEIKLSELSVGLILLLGACSLDSCWFLLMLFAISH